MYQLNLEYKIALFVIVLEKYNYFFLFRVSQNRVVTFSPVTLCPWLFVCDLLSCEFLSIQYNCHGTKEKYYHYRLLNI